MNEVKLNCAGEFMSACENEYQLSTAVKALAEITGESNCDFTESFGDALIYAVQQAKEERAKSSSENPDLSDETLGEILEFCHASLVKAYNKKTGRA